MNIAQYLEQESKAICLDNECTEDNHNCGSYAYINADMNLLNVCIPDYFQGYDGRYAAIPLPWAGSLKELEAAVKNELEY